MAPQEPSECLRRRRVRSRSEESHDNLQLFHPPDITENDANKTKTETNGMLSVQDIDALFPRASQLTVLYWMVLLLLVYASTPVDELVYLTPGERQTAAGCFVLMLVTNVVLIMPFVVQQYFGSSTGTITTSMSGILQAGITTCTISMMTNGILAFLPNPVVVDAVTHARTFPVRWCEWVPTAGLMTFMAEAVDLGQADVLAATRTAVLQMISTACGMLLPYCSKNRVVWICVLAVAFSTHLTLIPRVLGKRNAYWALQHKTSNQSTHTNSTFEERDYARRVRFAYHLILSCFIVWTCLVVDYFLNMYIHCQLDPGQFGSAAMMADSLFDVLAKALYNKLILEVHQSVVDTQGRTQNRLVALRNVMEVVWESSSDAIGISVQNNNKLRTAMFSLSFANLVGCELPQELLHQPLSKRVVLMLTIDASNGRDMVTSAVFAETDELALMSSSCTTKVLYTLPLDHGIVQQAHLAVTQMWKLPNAEMEKQSSQCLSLQLRHLGKGETRECQNQVSLHDKRTRIGVLRDVSAQSRILRAELKAQAESLLRHRDTQKANDFTRHEVKNGLLSGIALCDSLRASFEAIQDDDSSTKQRSKAFIEELDKTLQHILDAAVDEAMAREVIHGDYVPKPEPTDVVGLLRESSFGGGKSPRFSLEMPRGHVPPLNLDPHLLRYIHQSALSNACKHGKAKGAICTEVSFDHISNELCVVVTNAAGDNYETLAAMSADDANAAIFSKGSGFASREEHTTSNYIFTSYGAWMMKRCAETAGGSVDISFSNGSVALTFLCPAQVEKENLAAKEVTFQVPAGTWGLAIDDSKVQRKLLGRILKLTGVNDSNIQVLGESYEQLEKLGTTIRDLLSRGSPTDKILILVDENLDYRGGEGNQLVLSGSLIMEEILKSLSPGEESRILALVRSANDSAEDIARYTRRTHGFFPKAPVKRDRIPEVLAPLWRDRFAERGRRARTRSSFCLGQDLIASFEHVESCLQEKEENDNTLSHQMLTAVNLLKQGMDQPGQLGSIVKTLVEKEAADQL